MSKNQFGFFVSDESVRFLTTDNIEKTQLKVYLKNCSVYSISSLINEKKSFTLLFIVFTEKKNPGCCRILRRDYQNDPLS